MSGAEPLGTFAQIDSYFFLGERRLKLRSVEGATEGQLVYYERPDMSGVKESRVLLASVSDAVAVREILTQVLPVKAEVRKTREIYRLQGVQVHLDTVVGLGKFLELEKILSRVISNLARLLLARPIRMSFKRTAAASRSSSAS